MTQASCIVAGTVADRAVHSFLIHAMKSASLDLSAIREGLPDNPVKVIYLRPWPIKEPVQPALVEFWRVAYKLPPGHGFPQPRCDIIRTRGIVEIRPRDAMNFLTCRVPIVLRPFRPRAD